MMRNLSFVFVVTFCLPALAETPLPAPAVPTFVEETASAGIGSTYQGEWETIVGGGVATFDCNGDMRPDILLPGGQDPAKLYVNDSAAGGSLHFKTQESGLEQAWISGAYALDIDSDGVTDLVLLRVGENMVMRGLGDCRFERANEAWGFDGGDGWSTAFAATWEKAALWPTLAIGNYIDRTQEDFPWGHCTDNWLHRPGKGQSFAAPLPLTPSYCALSMLFTDWNHSGTPSLRVSNDREYYKGGQEQLWHLDSGQPPALYTEKDGWARLRIWGMGIASNDLNGDGYPEYFLTSMADNKLQTLAEVPEAGNPAPKFADIAFKNGVTAHRPYTGDETRPSTAWHAQFEDVNNDGFVDLFVAKGNVWAMPDFAEKDPNNLLLQKSDGTFEEAGDRAGVASFLSARGAALADFNLDGLLDLVVVNRNAPAQLWRNTGGDTGGGTGNWLSVDLHQPGPNRAAIGAWVELRSGERLQRREVTVGGGHAGGVYGPQHFGLGRADKADVRVIWPDGTEGAWTPIAANQRYLIDRDTGPVALIAP